VLQAFHCSYVVVLRSGCCRPKVNTIKSWHLLTSHRNRLDYFDFFLASLGYGTSSSTCPLAGKLPELYISITPSFVIDTLDFFGSSWALSVMTGERERNIVSSDGLFCKSTGEDLES
jgi:hypothetical protein